MTEYVWSDVRAHAIGLFGGDAPGALLEQQIVDVFEQRPQAVVSAVDRVAAKFAAGSVRSPWAILARECSEALRAGPDVRASDGTDLARALLSAERFILSAGLHFDREEEIMDELFGDRGRLKAWANDLALRSRMVAKWREARPAGERVEVEELERAAQWLRVQAEMAAKAREALAAARVDNAAGGVSTFTPTQPVEVGT